MATLDKKTCVNFYFTIAKSSPPVKFWFSSENDIQLASNFWQIYPNLCLGPNQYLNDLQSSLVFLELIFVTTVFFKITVIVGSKVVKKL